MERVFDGKYHWNKDYWQYERADKVQMYKGVKIISIKTHPEGSIEGGRYYEVTWPDGHVGSWRMKKGHSLKTLKEYIDFKAKYNEL